MTPIGDRYRRVSLFCAARYSWTGNVAMCLTEIGCKDDTWIDLFVNIGGTRLLVS
jgi:hypothetical protein